jgi:hypothetical protein
VLFLPPVKAVTLWRMTLVVLMILSLTFLWPLTVVLKFHPIVFVLFPSFVSMLEKHHCASTDKSSKMVERGDRGERKRAGTSMF